MKRMQKSHEEMADLFKKNGIKNTRQRQRVFNYLISCKQPVTADAIYDALRKEIVSEDTLNLSTVYRILDIFTKNRLVTKTSFGNDHKAVFELYRLEHCHHLICVKCNEITPIKGCPLKGYEQSLSQTTHFKILEHHLEILGVCPKCQ